MQPKERLKTAGFLKKEVELIIETPYRVTEAAINQAFSRGSEDWITLPAIYDDILRSNCMEEKKEEARRILKMYQFDWETGKKIGGIDSLSDQMKAGLMGVVVIGPDENEVNQLRQANVALPDEYTEFDGEVDPAAPANEESEKEHQYSQPDTREFVVQRKRRKKRNPVSPEEMKNVLTGYEKWWNENNSDFYLKILHRWELEKDPEQVVYIYIDGDCVFKQAELRIPGGSDILRDKKSQHNHYNAVICAAGYEPYYITYPEDVDIVCKEILATLLVNHLLDRNLVFFIDGEKALYDSVETYFEYWNPAIYLDWYHLLRKIYECFSRGLKGGRVDDPRTPEETYKRGVKKGQPKPRKQTSQNVLYYRMLASIFWVGNVDEASAYIKNIDPKEIDNKTAIDELLSYLDRKGKYITCYALRKRAGLRNSSNIVESANRRMVSSRQKHRGMLWSMDGSNAITAETVLFMNKEEDRWFYNHEVTFMMRPVKEA